MCARILGERRAGHKRARMEKWSGDFIKRVIAAYGRALDKFLDRAWLTIPISSRLHSRSLVFLHSFAIHITPAGRQRLR